MMFNPTYQPQIQIFVTKFSICAAAQLRLRKFIILTSSKNKMFIDMTTEVGLWDSSDDDMR